LALIYKKRKERIKKKEGENNGEQKKIGLKIISILIYALDDVV
jgi:hypothetical protein